MGFHFAAVLVFAIVAVGFALGGITLSRIVAPKLPNPEKASIYECGERPIGAAWFNFNPRFYLVALVFVIFEVDIALTFPVVAVYRQWVEASPALAWVAFVELVLFTGILVVGLVWVWAHGDLEWVKKLAEAPRPASPAQERLEAPRGLTAPDLSRGGQAS
jgi:NADH-quinone oxidoreductase subunit A